MSFQGTKRLRFSSKHFHQENRVISFKRQYFYRFKNCGFKCYQFYQLGEFKPLSPGGLGLKSMTRG